VRRNDGAIFSAECATDAYVGPFPNHAHATGYSYLLTDTGWRAVTAGELFVQPDALTDAAPLTANGDTLQFSSVGSWDSPHTFSIANDGIRFFAGYLKHAVTIGFAAVKGDLTCPFDRLLLPTP
jgi:hypothetical protein